MSLNASRLAVGYGRHAIIHDINFELAPGTVTTLLGPNGCGKSTLLKTLAGLRPPQQGTVTVNGKSLSDYPRRDLAKILTILPQLHHTPPEITVNELVALGRYPHRANGFFFSETDRVAVDRALAATRLHALRHRYMRTLSGGERQRVWIALALAQSPEILLLDEPTTFLDLECQLEIANLIRSLNQTYQLTVLMVLHDLNLAANFSDRLLLVKDGMIRYDGTPPDIVTPPIIRDIFNVEAEVIRRGDGKLYSLPLAAESLR